MNLIDFRRIENIFFFFSPRNTCDDESIGRWCHTGDGLRIGKITPFKNQRTKFVEQSTTPARNSKHDDDDDDDEQWSILKLHIFII